MFSVVIPAFNEAGRLPATLEAVRGYFDGTDEEYEVIVVDDGSTDSTAADAEERAQSWPQLAVIRLHRNSGKGAAVRAGMLAARGRLRLFTDADLSAPVAEVSRLRDRIGGNCQVAIGSRAVRGAMVGVHQPLRRELMGRTYNLFVQLFVIRGIRDTQCGLKLYTDVAAVACFEPLTTHRFGFDVEVLLRARQHGWEVAEVPVHWNHVEASRVDSLRDSARMLYDLVRLKFIVRSGRTGGHRLGIRRVSRH